MLLERSMTQAVWRDPVMPFVESRRACRSRACYKPHLHPTFSIGAVDEGCSLFTDGSRTAPVRLLPGTLVFVPAERVHACNPMPGMVWSYQMLHLDADWLHAVRSEYAGKVPLIAEPVRISTGKADYARFCQLNKLLFSVADAVDKEAALIEFIGDFDLGQGLKIEPAKASQALTEQIRQVLDFLHASVAVNIGLDELAGQAGLSRYQFIRAFRSVTGMTPHAWQLNQRINLARERLRDGVQISALSLELGFADQAHFQRVFKAHTGITPRRFRAGG